MHRKIQKRRTSDPISLDFAQRERALKNHWLELKMHLRATRYPMPEHAIRKYLEEKANFERGMKWLNEARKHTVAGDASPSRNELVGPTGRVRKASDTAAAGRQV